MKKQKILSDVLAGVIGRMIFPVEYRSMTYTDTEITLYGFCDIRHLQPGKVVSINSISYRVKSYSESYGNFDVVLERNSGQAVPPESATFNLYTPKFFHGTPLQQEVDFKKIKDQQAKTPMIYLMEPYQSKANRDFNSSIYSSTQATLCFLAEADIMRLNTDDLQYSAVKPMYNLSQDFVAKLIESGLFYTEELDYSITIHTKFGINIRDSGTKKTIFTENLSGVSLDIRLDLFKDDSCCKHNNFLLTSQGKYLETSGGKLVEVD